MMKISNEFEMNAVKIMILGLTYITAGFKDLSMFSISISFFSAGASRVVKRS